MKEVVLITGAGGILAQQLAQQLKPQYSVRFLSRNAKRSDEFQWNVQNKSIDPLAFKGVNHIVHLAGASVAEKRWTPKRKKEILASRIDSATLIRNELTRQSIVIDSFISASAVGYYGNETTDVVYSEESPAGKGFLSEVCQQWELVAESFKIKNVAKRIAVLRIGMILSNKGGLLKKIRPLTKYYLGAALGNGKQYSPWIHIGDLCNMIKFMLDNKQVSGTFNAVAPEHISNRELTKAIAKAMNRAVILPNIPKLLIRAILGEMSGLFVEGVKVSPNKIINTGFDFKYSKCSNALANLMDEG